MKILAVCGFGVGSSMVLKMTIEKVLKDIGVDGEVENTDLSSARGTKADAIFTSAELADDLRESSTIPVFPIKKYMDKVEVRKSLEEFLKDK